MTHFSNTKNPVDFPDLRRRSLAELDDVIDEIIARNPEFVEKINKIVEEKRNKDVLRTKKTQGVGSK